MIRGGDRDEMSTVITTKSGGEAARWYSPTFMHTMTAGAWWRLLTAHGAHRPTIDFAQSSDFAGVAPADGKFLNDHVAGFLAGISKN